MPVLTELSLKSPLDGFEFSAVRAATSGTRRGGVIVIQEIFGVTEHIREICSFFGDHGYEAIAPSLYDRIEPHFLAGMEPEGFAKAVKGAQTTPLGQAMADTQAAIDALGDGPKFITGFCYGGGISWLAAGRCTGLSAASGFYGSMINQVLDTKPKVPIILHYGAKDAHIPPEAVEKVRASAPDVPIYVYDAGHGFCRKASADYHEASRDLGLQRTLDFFAQHG